MCLAIINTSLKNFPFDQQQHGELRRRQLQRRDATDEIIEDSQLGALQRVAEQFRQLSEFEFVVLAGGGGRRVLHRLDQVERWGLGNSHRLLLVIPVDWKKPRGIVAGPCDYI